MNLSEGGRSIIWVVGLITVSIVAGLTITLSTGHDVDVFVRYCLQVATPSLASLLALVKVVQVQNAQQTMQSDVQIVKEQTNGNLQGPLNQIVTDVAAVRQLVSIPTNGKENAE